MLVLHVMLVFTALTILACAAISDVKGLTIPNWTSLALLGLLVPEWATCDVVNPAASFLAFSITFAVTYLLWRTGNFGGGDVKLLSATAAWAGTAVLQLAVLTAILGGVVSVVVLALTSAKSSSDNHAQDNLRKLQVPYGVAISAAGAWVILCKNHLTP